MFTSHLAIDVDRCLTAFCGMPDKTQSSSVQRIWYLVCHRWCGVKRPFVVATTNSEVVMQGRRRHVRFSFLKSEGTLTVLRDVLVQTTETGDLVAVDTEPRRRGELLTLETVVNKEIVAIRVRVITSRPIIQGGEVLNQLLMRPLEENR
jgi:hypothetical protein